MGERVCRWHLRSLPPPRLDQNLETKEVSFWGWNLSNVADQPQWQIFMAWGSLFPLCWKNQIALIPETHIGSKREKKGREREITRHINIVKLRLKFTHVSGLNSTSIYFFKALGAVTHGCSVLLRNRMWEKSRSCEPRSREPWSRKDKVARSPWEACLYTRSYTRRLRKSNSPEQCAREDRGSSLPRNRNLQTRMSVITL